MKGILYASKDQYGLMDFEGMKYFRIIMCYQFNNCATCFYENKESGVIYHDKILRLK